MIRLYKVLAFIVLSIALSCSTNDNEGKKNSDYPDADAVYLSLEKTFELNTDGSITQTISKKLLLQSYASFNHFYGETFIVYNPKYQKITINNSKTILPDNSEVVTPGNAFNEVLPYFAVDFPYANHLREKVITHTGLEKHAIIDLSYTIYTQKEFAPALMGDVAICQNSPSQEVIIKIIVPEHTKINYQLLNDTVQVNQLSSNGKTTYQWLFKNVNASNREVAQNAIKDYEARLCFSTAKNIDELYKDIAKQQNDTLHIPNAIKLKIDEHLKKEKTSLEKINFIKQFVATQINNRNVSPLYLGYQSRSVADMWMCNNATPYEKTFMLSSLLSYININNQVIATYPKPYTAEAANLLNIKNYYVAINDVECEKVILKATDSNMINHADELIDYNVLSGAKINPAITQKNEIIVSGNIALGSNNIKGLLHANFTGNTFLFPEILLSPNLVEKLLNTKAKITTKSFTANEFVADYFLDLTSPYEVMHHYYKWELPASPYGIEKYHLPLLPKKRKTSFILPYPISEKYDYTIDYPTGYTPVIEDVHIEHNYSFGKIKIDFLQGESKIIVSKHIIINKTEIKTNEYEDFRKAVSLWSLDNYKYILIKKIQKDNQ